MKTKFCICSQFNYLTPRTAIGALHAVRQSRTSSQILFAVCLIKKQALTGGTSLACEDKCSKKIGAVLVQQADRRSFEAECAVPMLVYFYITMISKYWQSAKRRLLLGNPTDRTFENRPMKKVRPCTFFIPEFCLGKTLKAIITAIRGGELGKKVPQAYRVYVEETFLSCDAGDARIFSKEETGLYYYGARYLDPKYSRWLSGDPALGEYIPAAGEDISKLPAGGIFNVISFNLFNYANNNPIKYIDPSGRNPVYDTEGNLIGVTENSGLQGDAFIMNKEDYDAKMTLDDARDKNLGINGLNGQEALDKFNESFASLKDRPDWDAILTLEEANDWYKNGNGQELFVDINQIDLSMLLSLGEKNMYLICLY